MKNLQPNRRGSALLIVLGILSFMVVSAVAFSVLMRQSRLPSSFMRQRVTTSYLVKAALANAMAELDEAIGDNPYPGVDDAGGSSSAGNHWRGRVFMRTSSAASGSGDGTASGSGSSSAVKEQSGAVSTMPLEGLAYLPPPLIATVRYWMKRSPTAVWQGLGYDAGRYAYTAVNVSDYLDINRLRANVMRDCSPSNRISMAYVFENDDHTDDADVSPAKFDEFVRKASQDLDTRLVSMADYALASGSGKFGDTGFVNPFYEFIRSPTEGGGMSSGEADMASARRQKFVTDSWYPGSLTNTTTVALTSEEGQPFGSFDPAFAGGFLSLLQKGGSASFTRVMNHLNFPERVALKDYLDPDNVPTSLALPTMEHVPMLTGVRIIPLADTFKPVVEEVLPAKEEAILDGEGATIRRVRRLWKLKGFSSPSILASATAVFPFKRSSLEKSESLSGFKAQFLVKAYLVEEGKKTDDVRLADGELVRPTDKSEWRSANLLSTEKIPCLTFYGETPVSVPSSRQEESDVSFVCDPVEMSASMPSDLNCPLYGLEIKTPESGIAGGAGGVQKQFVYDESRFAELKGGENAVKFAKSFQSDVNKYEAPENVRGETRSLWWQFFAYVRIVDGDGNTVDMLPACYKDDKTYNGVDQGVLADGGNQSSIGEPTREAVVPVVGPKAMEFDKTTFFDETTWAPKAIDANNPIGFNDTGATSLAIYCDDPRYNWAPEDWYASDSGNIDKSEWLSQAKGSLTGSNCRPRDLFQFVSNRSYLQSMGEFQFLPLVRSNWGDYNINDFSACSFCNAGRYDGKPFSQRSRGSLANRNYMWKLYTFFPDNGSWTDAECDPYNWGIVDAYDGATVSPYAEEDLMMAALANTPYDFIVTAMAEAGDLTLEDGRKYCFSGFSSEAAVTWKEMKEVAANLRSGILSGKDWWEMENWAKDTGRTLFGASVGTSIHDVDRKFLAAYWRSCFANRQQLFLVFVRAEPTVMGAASAGHTPAQLGGRAVALVWREPVSTIPDSGSGSSGETEKKPHRMRILFYHQFE